MILGMPSKVSKRNLFAVVLSLLGHLAVRICYLITLFLTCYILVKSPVIVLHYYQDILAIYGDKVGFIFLVSAFLILVVVISFLVLLIFTLSDSFNKKKEVNVDIHYIKDLKDGTFEITYDKKVIRARRKKTRVSYDEVDKKILIDFKYGFFKTLRVESINSGDTYEKLAEVFDSLGVKVNFVNSSKA